MKKNKCNDDNQHTIVTKRIFSKDNKSCESLFRKTINDVVNDEDSEFFTKDGIYFGVLDKKSKSKDDGIVVVAQPEVYADPRFMTSLMASLPLIFANKCCGFANEHKNGYGAEHFSDDEAKTILEFILFTMPKIYFDACDPETLFPNDKKLQRRMYKLVAEILPKYKKYVLEQLDGIPVDDDDDDDDDDDKHEDETMMFMEDYLKRLKKANNK